MDPERSLTLAPREHRTIQIGVSGEAVDHYVNEWIVDITDVTTTARNLAQLIDHDDIDAAFSQLPCEEPYPLPDDLAITIGASH